MVIAWKHDVLVEVLLLLQLLLIQTEQVILRFDFTLGLDGQLQCLLFLSRSEERQLLLFLSLLVDSTHPVETLELLIGVCLVVILAGSVLIFVIFIIVFTFFFIFTLFLLGFALVRLGSCPFSCLTRVLLV